MTDMRKPRRGPYWQPPDNPVSDERRALLLTFEHEIRAAQGNITVAQLAVRLLTRLDLRGWGPGQRPTGAAVRPRHGVCPTHAQQQPCRGCAADRKAAPDQNEDTA
jgi:hypothetical protein